MTILRKRMKTNSKTKQQQTLITSKLYVRYEMQNLITKSTQRQIKTKTKKITDQSSEKTWDRSIKTFVNK